MAKKHNLTCSLSYKPWIPNVHISYILLSFFFTTTTDFFHFVVLYRYLWEICFRLMKHDIKFDIYFVVILLYFGYRQWTLNSARLQYTVWCNQIGTVFAVIASWITLSWHSVIKQTLRTNIWKANIFGFLIRRYFNKIRKCILTYELHSNPILWDLFCSECRYI